MSSDSHYLTAEQISAELGVHLQTVQKYFRDGGLPGRKVGNHWQTTRAALDRWIEGGNANDPASAFPALERAEIDLETK